MDAAVMHQSCRHLIKKSPGAWTAIAPKLQPCSSTAGCTEIRRYAHAKQYKRMRKAVKALCTLVRRPHMLFEAAKTRLQDPLQRTARILTRCAKDKPYALRAPETECISKGQARIPPAGSM